MFNLYKTTKVIENERASLEAQIVNIQNSLQMLLYLKTFMGLDDTIKDVEPYIKEYKERLFINIDNIAEIIEIYNNNSKKSFLNKFFKMLNNSFNVHKYIINKIFEDNDILVHTKDLEFNIMFRVWYETNDNYNKPNDKETIFKAYPYRVDLLIKDYLKTMKLIKEWLIEGHSQNIKDYVSFILS